MRVMLLLVLLVNGAFAQSMSLLGMRSEYAAGAGVAAEPSAVTSRAVSIVVNAGSGDTERRITTVRWPGVEGLQLTLERAEVPAGATLEVYGASAAKVMTVDAAALAGGIVVPGRGQYLDGDTIHLRLIAPSGSVRVVAQAAQRPNAVYGDLAAHWAPHIYQDTDSDGKKYDLIAAVDFDGDFNGDNNWDNAGRAKDYPLGGDHHNQCALYWWVSESSTHYFVGYADFHPRDWEEGARTWGPLNFGEHENDFEGWGFWIRKDGTPHGKLELMQTVSHTDLWQYGDASIFARGKENVDGPITFEGGKPCVYIEAKGHGVRGQPHEGGKHGVNFGPEKGDGVIYYAGEYALKPARSLWAMKEDPAHRGGGKLFHNANMMRGTSHGTNNAASFPWAWQDEHYDDFQGGTMFTDPGGLVNYQFELKAPVDKVLTGKSW